VKRLEEKERNLEEVLDNFKSDPSKNLVARSWNKLKFVRRDVLTEAEKKLVFFGISR
jgi:hypothetical protein